MLNHSRAFPGADDITRQEMPNGIVVLVRENHDARSVVITGTVNAGSLLDPPGADGLSAFTTLMLMRGTTRRDFVTIHEMLEGSGASLSISGGVHSASFSGKALAEDLPMLVDLLADALCSPSFPAEHIERLRGQLVTGLKIREQDTRYRAEIAFRELAYPEDHPYRRRAGGTVESVQGITREQMVDFYQHQFGPQGMVVVIVGAVRTDEAIRCVEEYLGGWTNSHQVALPDLHEIPAVSEIREQHIALPGKSQVDLVMGRPGPSRRAEDWHAVSLANSILGVFGMYGRIGAEVREKRGMAYYSTSTLEGGLGPGAWRVIAGVNPVNVGPAVNAIRDEIRRMVQELVSTEELEDNKANFIGRLPLRLETNEGVAGSLLAIERYGLGLNHLRNYEAEIRAITAEDVLRAAQRYFSADAYALAAAGPAVNGHE